MPTSRASTRDEDSRQSYYRQQFPPRLLTSNLPPTDQEVLHVESTLLPAIQRSRDNVKARITALRETMRQLKAEQEALSGEYEICESLVSTRRTVPCEIWAHIFSYFRGSSSKCDSQERNAFSSSRTLWTVSQVCQAWRNIAFSMPALWSCIELYFPEDGQKEVDVYMLERILLLSRQFPLRIVLHNALDIDCSYYGPSFRNLMLQKVFAESHRWRSVELIDDCADSDVLFPETLHGRLPLLENLHLDLRQFQTDGATRELEAEDQPVIRPFGNCPRLSKMKLTGGRRVIDLPRAQITELDIEDTESNWLDHDCISYVRSLGDFPSLKVLHMMPFDYDDEEEVASEVITINSLHKLDTSCVQLLNHLTVPHLQEATLRRYPRLQNETAFASFSNLIHRSHCAQSTTSLTIDDIAVPLEDHELYELLLCMPNITHLTLRLTMSLSRPSVDTIQRPPNELLMFEVSGIIDRLEVCEDYLDRLFLPRLSSLSLELKHHAEPGYVPYFGPEGAFPRIMQSRWRDNRALGFEQLKSCSIVLTAAHLEKAVFRDGTSGRKTWDVLDVRSEVQPLRALIADGMKLSIRIISDLAQENGRSHTILDIPMSC